MIFVIGGNGFVGSAICRELNRKNLEYEVLTRQNIDSFTGKECDIVINANGNSKKFIANEDPIREFNESVLSVRKSLENIRYKKYIYLSSCDVYEDCSSPALTKEETCIDIKNQSTYGFHKYLAEQCVQHVAENWIIFRMGGFVGEGLKKNAIYDILNGGPLWLSSDSELEFIHTDEASHIIVELASSDITKEIYNLCGNGVVKLRDVMDELNVNIDVKENSQIVKYEVCIDKILSLCNISESRQTVLEYAKTNNVECKGNNNFIPCPICNSRENDEVTKKGNHRLLICGNCRHMFWNIMPTDDELCQYYASIYTEAHGQKELQESEKTYYNNHIKELKSYIKSYSVKPNSGKYTLVDFGCSYPVLLIQAKKQFSCIGIESDNEARIYGEKNNIKMFKTEEFFQNQPNESIDIFRCSHVLEHLIDPHSILKNVYGKMRKGGILYITQPNFPIYKYGCNLTDVKDSVYPEHLHFFNMISLTDMIEKSGFEVIRLFTHTEEKKRFKEDMQFIDQQKARQRLCKYEKLGDSFFGVENNFPFYCGENSVLIAIKK